MRPVTHPGRRADGDRGASMVIVAIVLTSLLAMAALAVDIAALVQERRTLQNSADAAAMAIAQDCVKGNCVDFATTAATYATKNADDGFTNVKLVCGVTPKAGVGLHPCDPQPASVPAGAQYVQVNTETETAGQTHKVPFSFARVMDRTWDGKAVHATATVVWGSPKVLTTIPATISLCEWSQFTNDGTSYESPPPYSSYPPSSRERVLQFHQNESAVCPKGPAGANIPANWGLLMPDDPASCRVTPNALGEVKSDWGNNEPECDQAAYDSLVGTVVHLPVFDYAWGPGGHGFYHVKGYAAFFLTGYLFKKNQYEHVSILNNRSLTDKGCSNNVTCIAGFFLSGQLTSQPGTVGGDSLGSLTIQFVE